MTRPNDPATDRPEAALNPDQREPLAGCPAVLIEGREALADKVFRLAVNESGRLVIEFETFDAMGARGWARVSPPGSPLQQAAWQFLQTALAEMVTAAHEALGKEGRDA